MARIRSTWTLKQGRERWMVAEQLRLTPAPKLGGWAGKQLRFLGVSRGESVLTDIEPDKLAVSRRVAGLPSMQRMWFSRSGHSLGYTNPRSSTKSPALFFFDCETRLSMQYRLAASVSDATAGSEQWFVGCRDGHVYAFSFTGSLLWKELIPYAPRDEATNALWGLPIFHPPLLLAAAGNDLVVGAAEEFHRYEAGDRLWSERLSPAGNLDAKLAPGGIPSREHRLSRLGLAEDPCREGTRTGYLRLSLDTLLNAGWLKQVEAYEIENGDDAKGGLAINTPVDSAFSAPAPRVSVIRAFGAREKFPTCAFED